MVTQDSFNKAGYILLNQMIEGGAVYDTFLDGDNCYLESILTDLASRDWIQIIGSTYQVTRQGREAYEAWIEKYYDWIPRLEVFSAVDLRAGEFAFARYYEFSDDQSWEDFLNQSRFQDVRLAVCEYHKLDREEIVFMSFLNEGRWKNLNDTPGWQFDLGSGKIMEEIKDIISKSITIESLGYQGPEGFVSGEAVIEDIIRQGETLSVKLWEKEKEINRQDSNRLRGGHGLLQREAKLDDAYDV